MGYRALIDGEIYTADHPAIKEMQKNGAEILCPDCKKAGLSHHRESVKHDEQGYSFKVSAHFVTRPTSVHAEWCTYPVKKNDKDEKEPAIVIFDRHFGEIKPPESSENPPEKYSGPQGEKREFPEPRITSLKKFVSFLRETLTDPELTNKPFRYRGEERKWNEIYFDSRNMKVLYDDALKTECYRLDNEAVFAKIKTDKSVKTYVDETMRKRHNPDGKYSVYGLPFTYITDSGNYQSVKTRMNFSDRSLMEKFLENEAHIVWAVPRVRHTGASKEYLDFDIHAKEQFEALSGGVQTSMFNTEKPQPGHGRKAGISPSPPDKHYDL